MSTVTAKIQIFPDKEVQSVLRNTIRVYKSACNWLSEKVYQTHNLKQLSLQQLYYYEMRERFGLKSQMCLTIMRIVIGSYKAMQSNGHDWIQVRYTKDIYELSWNRDYSLNQYRFSVNSLAGRLQIPYEIKGMSQYFDKTWKFGTAKLVIRQNKWFLYIPMTKVFDEIGYDQVNNVVGVDLGINFIAVTYDSQGKSAFYPGRKIKHQRAHYKALRKQLQQLQTPSARSKIKRIGQRENRYVHDVNHQVTKALVERYPKGTCFVLEDLTGIRNATEKVKVNNRYVSVSWAFYQFRCMLEYKAKLYGHIVLIVDPRYTSQTCPKCGHVAKSNRNKKLHTFCCKNCNYTSNDDRIGAMNLYRKGVEYLSTCLDDE